MSLVLVRVWMDNISTSTLRHLRQMKSTLHRRGHRPYPTPGVVELLFSCFLGAKYFVVELNRKPNSNHLKIKLYNLYQASFKPCNKPSLN